jgi:hypothetical protein
VQAIADAEGKRALGVYLDIGIASDSQTRFQVEADRSAFSV